jgi:DNA modification methylase
MIGTNKIYQGDCLKLLKQIDDNTIDCCVTSPPYWGLRDYGHVNQLGLEKTPEEYVSKMVAVFREVKRVLQSGGTLWINLGDTYATHGGCNGSKHNHNFRAPDVSEKEGIYRGGKPFGKQIGMKEKDLVGIPWMVAFALRADGWYLRQDIIWHKPNPMPESVADRCTKNHEYIFLMSKSARYYFDSGAIAEKTVTKDDSNRDRDITKLNNVPGRTRMGGLSTNNYDFRHKRSVWSVTTKPYLEAHFAVYPEDLIEPCVLAGCPEDGIVLDPFMGSGTTAVVAVKNNRKYIGLELNPEYIKIAEKRIYIASAEKRFADSQIKLTEYIDQFEQIRMGEQT